MERAKVRERGKKVFRKREKGVRCGRGVERELKFKKEHQLMEKSKTNNKVGRSVT